ncbi:MAG: polyprenyl synthetase family protein, partial [Halioglobus sp.]|nr:polyprenyl synthetase family protein [Halioglobus sp.]
MTTDFSGTLKQHQESIRTHLQSILDTLSREDAAGNTVPAEFRTVLAYALQNTGKLVRPLLTRFAYRAVSGSDDFGPAVDNAGCAVELVHTYSLIHDDLPAMDDDDLRRGQPTLHRAFDEATAILAGDGLQALAFQLLADA